MKRRADFERPALAHAATPAGPLTSTKGFIKRRMFNRIGVGDELPNSFLERRRLGRPLPCTIRLRAQRSDHVAVVRCQSARQLDMRCAPHTSMVALRGKTIVYSSFD